MQQFLLAHAFIQQRQTRSLVLRPNLNLLQIRCSCCFPNPMAYPQQKHPPNQTPLGRSFWSIARVSRLLIFFYLYISSQIEVESIVIVLCSRKIQRGVVQHTGGQKCFSTLGFIRKRSFSLHQLGPSQEGYLWWTLWMGPWYYLLTSKPFTFLASLLISLTLIFNRKFNHAFNLALKFKKFYFDFLKCIY